MRIWKERLWKGTELDIFKRTTNTYINSEEAVQSLPEPLLASFSQIRDEISFIPEVIKTPDGDRRKNIFHFAL